MDPSKHAYYPPSIPPHHGGPPPYYPQHPNAVLPPMMPQPHPISSNDYRVVVRGHVNRSAREFAIDIVSNGQILLHMNQRWHEGHTVFNSQGVNGWGAEEKRHFRNLDRGSNFVIVIHSSGGYFHIDVNGEKYTYQQRIPAGPAREVRISKVNHQDVNISGVEVAPF